MKFPNSVLLLASLFLCSSMAHSAIDVTLDKNVDLIATNGQEVGLRIFNKSQLELDNGLNQVVVRVAKLVRQSNGEFEKFNSDPVIITFEAKDQSVTLEPSAEISSINEANQFNQLPKFSLIATSGELIRFEQELLQRGPGITRDYEKEILRYNNHRKIPIQKVSRESQFSESKPAHNKTSKWSENSVSLEMIKQQYQTLSNEQKKQFLSWAISQ